MSESGPKLLDLIPKEKEKMIKKVGNEERRYVCCSSSSDENKLELRLGLPGDEIWCAKNNPKSREREDSLLYLGYFKHNTINGGASCCSQHQQQQHQHQQPLTANATSSSPFLQNKHHQNQFKTCTQQNKGVPVMVKDASQPCCTRIVELQTAEKKAFSPSSANTAVPNTSQKRAAPTPVVGWPPIRSFRKNLGSSSSGKPVPEPQSAIPSKPVVEKPANDNKVNNHKGLFVKINMDGIPIGRKVDLSAHNNYDSLSSAVNELFRGLLAAQRDSSGGSIDNKQGEQKPITGVLGGSGEYTLVYEDNEGDRMLVGDVPWHMFVSTVKRLRVLKSSDLASVSRGGNNREGKGKVMVEIPSK